MSNLAYVTIDMWELIKNDMLDNEKSFRHKILYILKLLQCNANGYKQIIFPKTTTILERNKMENYIYNLNCYMEAQNNSKLCFRIFLDDNSVEYLESFKDQNLKFYLFKKIIYF